jgi:NitT/TauT family transport system permease protein
MNRSTWLTKSITVLSVLILLGLWQLGAYLLDSGVLLPTPGVTGSALMVLLQQKPFSLNVLATVIRALQSFIIIFLVGGLFGVMAGYSKKVHAFLIPVLVICKATPVMSVILLAFIWFSSGTVPLFSAFLMGFPVMFVQVEQGVKQLSPRLHEMTVMYGFSPLRRLIHFVIPSLTPSIITGAKASLSMVWKVVIAAEVLTVPRYGVGSRMQLAQVHLETAEVLAWTMIAVLLTAIGDLLFIAMLNLPKKLMHARQTQSMENLQ